MACHPRATCHSAGCCHLVNSLSWFQRYATLQGAVTWRNQCHDSATLQGVRIPSAILKIVFFAIFYFLFVFNAVWALTSGVFRIVSDTLVVIWDDTTTRHLNTNEAILMTWSVVQGHETIDFGAQVKGQGHSRSQLDLKVWTLAETSLFSLDPWGRTACLVCRGAMPCHARICCVFDQYRQWIRTLIHDTAVIMPTINARGLHKRPSGSHVVYGSRTFTEHR